MFLTLALLVAMPQDPAPAPPPAAPGDRIKCRVKLETGSLVKRTRTCRPVSEWRKLDEEQRSSAYRAVDQGAVSCGECRQ